MRVEFDSTIEEVVDASMRMVQPTAAYRRARAQYQWLFGLCVAGGLAVGALHGDKPRSYLTIAVASFVALIAGLAAGMIGGRFHSMYAKSHSKRVLGEMYGRPDVVHCECELRDDVFWSRSIYAEVSFPWSRLTRVEDLPGLVEVWFSPGLAIVRDRAFRNQEQRQAFLDAIREHLH
jgi:hypothetical protein